MDFVQICIFAEAKNFSAFMNISGCATVVKHTGSHYLLTELPEWNLFPAVIKGKLRLKDFNSTNPVAVGDRVEYRRDASGAAVISAVMPRKNCIIRKSANLSRQAHVIAANIDMTFLVVTVSMPQIKLPFVDRFLVTCQAYGVPVTLVINKMDLYNADETEIAGHLRNIYEKAGYMVLECSAVGGEGIWQLREMCKERIVLFSGQSGVGKSSLIKALDPSLDLKIGEISLSHRQGRHTTTFYQMHPLSGGGFLIDSPGIRGFGLVDFNKYELSAYFPEMLKVEDNCRFVPCTHTHEPGCAVKEALENGDISAERYESYLGMLEEEGKYRI